MKKTLERSAVLLAVVTLFTFLSVIVFAGNQEKYVYDRAGIFNSSELQRIEQAASEAYSGINAQLYIVTDDTENITYWGEDFISEYGIDGNVVVFIITANSKNNYNIYTYGRANTKIGASEVDSILDHPSVYNAIKSGNYCDGAIAFAKLSADAYKTNVGTVITVALLIAAVVTLITGGSIVYSYNKKQRSEKYPLERYASLDLKECTDTFAGQFVTSRKIQTSSSGGGGGKSSGGGGGGGHRGGR